MLLLDIDITSRDDSNMVNPTSRRVLPVAILGKDRFDLADLDVTTLFFGRSGADFVFDLTNPLVYFLSHLDVNHDDRKDLLSSYLIGETGLAIGDTEACSIVLRIVARRLASPIRFSKTSGPSFRSSPNLPA
jgi:hypothetical protein